MEQLSQSMEDYLEAILFLKEKKKVVRVKDLVKRLGVRSASVIGALKRLEEKGLVEHEHYGYIELTPQGERMALKVFEKHQTLFKFLVEILGVDEETAEKDACLIEHQISDETYEKIIKFIHFIDTCPEQITMWRQTLRDYMKSDKQLAESEAFGTEKT
jgi:DtxR family Mn-dependent transcriptional regulator